jgi:hypothetical protein
MNYPSQQRKESMALAFAELDKVANPVICEVGRLRNIHAGESDGHSTLAFLEYVNQRKGVLFSIDKDSATERTCINLITNGDVLTFVKGITFVNEDAVKFFFNCLLIEDVRMINLLYLDGWDLNDPDSAKRHLTCFMLAESLVKPGGLVLIDDTGYPDLGKGKLVVPVAVLMGWTVLHQGFQTLLRKTL